MTANDASSRQALQVPDADAKTPLGRRMRLLIPLLLSNLALFMTYLGVNAVFLPTQISQIDPDPVRKALNLSIVAGGAAIVSLIAQPVIGALSDRSRRRNPWILGSALVAGLLLLWMPAAGSILVLLAIWCLVSFFMNGYQASVTAVIPDRVPRGERGVASAVIGAAHPAAAIIGVGAASALSDQLGLGYGIFGGVLIATAVIFIVSNRERALLPVAAVPLSRQFRTMLSALGHRDFLFAFLSRAAIMLAYLVVFSYMLFILTDRAVLPDGVTPTLGITLVTVAAAVAMVIGTIVGGVLADRLRRYRVFVICGAALMAVAAVPPLLSADFALLLVYGPIMGLGFGCFLAVDTAIVTLVLPHAESNARDLGVLNIANTAPQTLAAFVAGLIVASLGGGDVAYAALFVASIGFAIAGALFIAGVRGVR